ncbi:hypothetical protein HDU93_003407, partial [Gonapodya sp. JEL0774]
MLASFCSFVAAQIACPVEPGSYKADLDYFPTKATPIVSTQFRIQYALSFKVVTSVPTSEFFVLYLCNTPKPSMDQVAATLNTTSGNIDQGSVKFFQIPVQKVGVGARRVLGFFE